MPTYQYACTNADCGNRFELVQAFTDPAVSQCPVCGQRVRKVYGSVGVVFKGSGFYRNDSREGAKNLSGEVKSGSEGADSKPPTDAKPAAADAGSAAKSDKPSGGSAGSDSGGSSSSNSGSTTKKSGDSGASAAAKSASKSPTPG